MRLRVDSRGGFRPLGPVGRHALGGGLVRVGVRRVRHVEVGLIEASRKTHNSSADFLGRLSKGRYLEGACGRALQYHSREEACLRPSPPSRPRHGARRAARRVRATRRPPASRPGAPTLQRDPSARGRPRHALGFRGHAPRARRAAAARPSPRARARGSGTRPSVSERSIACPRSSRGRQEPGTPGTAPRPRSRVPGT